MEMKAGHKNERERKLKKNTHPDLMRIVVHCRVCLWFRLILFANLTAESKVCRSYNEVRYCKESQSCDLYEQYVMVYYSAYFINEENLKI